MKDYSNMMKMVNGVMYFKEHHWIGDPPPLYVPVEFHSSRIGMEDGVPRWHTIVWKEVVAMKFSAACSAVAESTGLKPTEVQGAVEGILAIAAEQIKKSRSFKLAGMLNFKLNVRPATKARKGAKAKPASKTIEVVATKKLKKLIAIPTSKTVEVEITKKLKKLIN